MSLVFTKRAKKNYHSIKAYIQEEWGKVVADAFESKAHHFLDLLEEFSELGSIEVPEKGISGFSTNQTYPSILSNQE